MQNLSKAKKFLSEADPVMAQLIATIPIKIKEYHGDHFWALTESIISQQLSVKVSDVIGARFLKLYRNKYPTPKQVLNTPSEKLRAIGLSNSKAAYIKDLAHHVHSKKLDLENIHTYSDDELITHLVQVKGIGKWTAEMFMMFALERPDIFSHGDLGLKNAIQKLYRLKTPPTTQTLTRISNKWKPYRTIACRYLWKSLEVK